MHLYPQRIVKHCRYQTLLCFFSFGNSHGKSDRLRWDQRWIRFVNILLLQIYQVVETEIDKKIL